MRRRTLAFSVAAVLLAPAPAHAASLSLRSAIAPPGATVALEGAGWRAGSTVTVRRRGGAALARAVVGFDGKLATSLRVPRGFKVRTQPLQARGRGQTVDAALRVVAGTRDWAPRTIATSTGVQIDISRTVAFPTAPVRIDARGLHEGDVASAQLRDGELVTARADRRGKATLRLTVPQTRLEGSTLKLRAGRIRRVEPYYVLPPQTVVPPLPQPIRPVPVLAAAGDIACEPADVRTATLCHQGDTSDLLVSAQPDVVAALGDDQYESGAPDEWTPYELSWGRLKARTRSAVGNHEYNTPGAAGYFSYFGATAGAADRGYYSYDLGAWHVIVLNSNCAIVPCVKDSAQERWLRADLAAHPDRCTLAYWHHPRHSSAQQTRENTSVQPLWQALADAGADVVITGHVHNYERIAPLDAAGNVDPARGIRSFVVGTGGRNHQLTVNRKPYSESSSTDTFGVLFLSLDPAGYGWAFQPEVGQSFVDTGSAACH
jgi:Calcineurin-like phosphoesterase